MIKKHRKLSSTVLLLNFLSVLLVIFLFLAFLISYSLAQDIQIENTKRINLIFNANRFINGSLYLTQEVRAYSATGNEKHYDNYWNEVNTLKNRDLALDEMIRIGLVDSEKSIIQTMGNISNSLIPIEEKAMKYVKLGDFQSAIEYVYGEAYQTEIKKIYALEAEFLHMVDMRTASAVQALSDKNAMRLTGMIAWLVLIVVLQIVNFIIIQRKIFKPLSVAEIAIHGLIIEGEIDLAYRIGVSGNDEIGRLCNDIDTFLGKQQNLILQLKGAQKDLGIIGENLSNSSQESASAIRQIMANIQGVRQQTEHQADTSKKTNEQMNLSLRSVEKLDTLIADQSTDIIESSASIEEMIGNIGSVTNSVQKMSSEFKELMAVSAKGSENQTEVNNSVREMAEQSKQLIDANIVIAQIATQTNLLAMNAAIEAAHAGKAGLGFSVVADEIRKLAENSSTQSKSIDQKLKLISQSIESVVKSSEVSESSFRQVSDKILLTDNLVSEIEGAMTEQKEVSEQVLSALRNISTSAVKVQGTAKEMKQDVSEVNVEINKLTQIGYVVCSSLDEMNEGVKEINISAQSVSDMAHKTKENIENMESFIGNFKV